MDQADARIARPVGDALRKSAAPFPVDRRAALFGVFALAVAAPAVAIAEAYTLEERTFIEEIAEMHPNGRAAAEEAIRAGMPLDELEGVHTWMRGADPANYPQLIFVRNDDLSTARIVSPKGRVR